MNTSQNVLPLLVASYMVRIHCRCSKHHVSNYIFMQSNGGASRYITPHSVHMAHGTWLHCLSWYYMIADDQQQGRLLHRQTRLGYSFLQSLPTDLLEHSSDATGAAEVVAGVSSIIYNSKKSSVLICKNRATIYART